MSTTAEYELTEQDRVERADHIRLTLEAIDRQSVEITNGLHRMRELHRAAAALDGIKTARLEISYYDEDEPWEKGYTTNLGLAESVQTVLAGVFREPIRDLLAATDAAEAALVRAGSDGEEDRARLERELRDLRG